MLTKEEFHKLIMYKTFMLSVNDIKYNFTYDKVYKENNQKEVAKYVIEVSEKGYFLRFQPFIYDTDDIILIPKEFAGSSLLLNPKDNQPHRRFINLKEI